MKYMNKKKYLVRGFAMAFGVVLLMMAFIGCVQHTEASTEGTVGSTQATAPTKGSETAVPNETIPDVSESDVTIPDDTEPDSGGEKPSTGPSGDDIVHPHSYEVYSTHYPTCTAKGYTVYLCDCGDSYQGDETSVLSHNYVATVVEPSYSAQGYTEHVCSMCQDRYRDSYVDKLVAPVVPGHTHAYVNTVVKPTCTENGYTKRVCSCGHSYQDTVVAATGHAMTSAVVQVTCTQAGYTKSTCGVCGYSYTYNNTPAAGHTYGGWVTVKEATETEQGEQKRTCSVCGNVNMQVVPMVGEVRDIYIDPRIELMIAGRAQNRCYTYNNVGVTDKCSWDNYLSLYINDLGGLDITYYRQDGTKVQYTLVPPNEEYFLRLTIQEDGTFTTRLNGDYSD